MAFAEFQNRHTKFVQFLSNPATSIPKGAQWVVQFTQLNSLITAIDEAYKIEPQSAKWKTTGSASTLLKEQFQNTSGCLFCTAIDLPGEGGEPVVEGSIKSNSFIRSYVGAGRRDFPLMRMSFIDTNISFCETFLRGWALATSAFGMIARDDIRYRTDLIFYKVGITPEGASILQQYTFYGVCCVNVGAEEYNYDPITNMPRREANFVYHSYSLDTETSNAVIAASINNRGNIAQRGSSQTMTERMTNPSNLIPNNIGGLPSSSGGINATA